jgi:hypothetical protein
MRVVEPAEGDEATSSETVQQISFGGWMYQMCEILPLALTF